MDGANEDSDSQGLDPSYLPSDHDNSDIHVIEDHVPVKKELLIYIEYKTTKSFTCNNFNFNTKKTCHNQNKPILMKV